MTERQILSYALERLKTKGISTASCRLSKSTKYEMNVEAGKMTLIRTVFNNNFSLHVIKDHRNGNYNVNKLDRETINQAIDNVIEITESSEPDPAHAIAECQPAAEFHTGPQEPDRDLMYQRFDEFLTAAKEKYPKIMFENAYFDFSHTSSYLANSNGVDFATQKGIYGFNSMFSANDGENSSSFNYTGVSMDNLDKSLLSYGSVDNLLKQSCEQITTQPLAGKFVGDVIITPDCLRDFIYYLFGITIYDGALISGTSAFKDKLGKQVADSRLTIHSRPISPEISNGYFLTSDGYKAENSTIIDAGVLNTFLLGLYGANKTGLTRSVNDGGCYVVEPGTKSFDQIVSKIDRGILLARYSGGSPSQNGDFSGVAKNSYYIEDGKIQHPISETMIAGNLIDILQNIIDISQERINFGSGIYPWIAFSGFTISGK